MMKRRLLTAAAVVLVIIVSALIYLLVDDLPPNLADLVPKRASLTPNENAFDLLSQARKKFVEPDNWYESLCAPRDERPVDDTATSRYSQRMKDVLARNTEVLRLLDEGVARGKLEEPEVNSFWSSDFIDWDDLGYLMNVRLYALSADGKRREALDEAVKILRFGKMIQCGADYFTGLSIKRACGYPAFAKFLCGAELDADAISGYTRQIAPLIDNGEDLANDLRALFRSAVAPDGFGGSGLPVLGGAGPPDSWTSFLYLPNATRRLLADAFRVSIRNIPRKPVDYEVSKLDSMMGPSPSRRWPLRNWGGVSWIARLWGSLDEFAEKRLDDVARNRGIRLLIALKLYHMKHGAIPPTLDNLVPEFIDAVPEDPFDGKPFRYIPAKKVLYSIGCERLRDGGYSKDQQDNGGDSCEDIVTEIGF